jgi:outer membrane protein OmpA-like peptidoglycan-associated protein
MICPKLKISFAVAIGLAVLSGCAHTPTETVRTPLPVYDRNGDRLSVYALDNKDMVFTEEESKALREVESETPVAEASPAQAIEREEVQKGPSLEHAGPLAVYFGEGEANLSDDDKDELAKWAQVLFSKNGAIRISGYTNSNGPEESNYELGLARARSVKKYLVSLGIPSEGIVVDSQGETSDLERKAIIRGTLAE